MPTTLRLVLLLMLGLFGLQPRGYAYDAPSGFVSEAQNIVATSPENQAATAETTAPVPLNFNRTRAAWDDSESIGLISNFVAAESGAMPTLTNFTSDAEAAMLKQSLGDLRGAGYDTSLFKELIRADMPPGYSGMSVEGGAALGDPAFASQSELTRTLEEELIHLQQKAGGAGSAFGPGTAQSLEEEANALKKF